MEMVLWVAVALLIVTTTAGDSGHVLQKRQASRGIPEEFQRRARSQLNLPEPTTIPTEDQRFSSCTYNRKRGYCRHVRFCQLEEFTTDYGAFIRNVCIINNNFLGVCCPDNNSGSNANALRSPSTGTSSGNRQFSKDCGVPFGTRIINGKEADPKYWLWMTALFVDNQFQCGGVLISSQYVLTAGHCLRNVRPSQLTLRVGEYNRDVNYEGTHEVSTASGIKIHPNHAYSNGRYIYDIALVKLSQPVPTGDRIRPICLPSSGTNYANRMARVAGWGRTEDGSSPNILREVEIPIWSYSECKSVYSNIRDHELCASQRGGGADACKGDSGGPLMVQDGDNRYSVVGIVAWGPERCGRGRSSGVYTSVQEFLDWIRQSAT